MIHIIILLLLYCTSFQTSSYTVKRETNVNQKDFGPFSVKNITVTSPRECFVENQPMPYVTLQRASDRATESSRRFSFFILITVKSCMPE